VAVGVERGWHCSECLRGRIGTLCGLADVPRLLCSSDCMGAEEGACSGGHSQQGAFTEEK
jgi:hypothetical protein